MILVFFFVKMFQFGLRFEHTICILLALHNQYNTRLPFIAARVPFAKQSQHNLFLSLLFFLWTHELILLEIAEH
jgi:hypothetical protein